MLAELRADGIRVAGKRVARIMRQRGLIGRCRRRWTTTTIPDPDLTDTVVDRLKRAFGPGTVELDRVYVGDITYIWTWEGWAYLATVIDLGSRRVVGWAIADHMRAELICDALTMAVGPAGRPPGRCSTPTAAANTPAPSSGSLLGRPRDGRLVVEAPSMLGQRRCGELLRDPQERAHRPPILATVAQVRTAVFEYIEVFYNRRRLHSTLGYLTPAEYESRKIHHHKAADAA